MLVGVGAAALCVALSAAGCSRGGSGPPTPSSSPSSSRTSVSPTPSIPVPTLPPEAQHPTPAGAAAFFRYFFAVYEYTYASLDDRPMRALSEVGCVFCSSVLSNVSATREANGRVVGGEVTVLTAVAGPGNPDERIVVNGLVNQASSVTYGPSGSTLRTAPSSTRQRVDAAVRWTQGKWRMLDVKVIQGGAS